MNRNSKKSRKSDEKRSGNVVDLQIRRLANGSRDEWQAVGRGESTRKTRKEEEQKTINQKPGNTQ